jgi:hypothetical protein
MRPATGAITLEDAGNGASVQATTGDTMNPAFIWKETKMKNRTAMTLSLVSLSLAIATAIALSVFPVYSNGMTLVEVNGSSALAPIFFPALLATFAIVIPRQLTRIIAALPMLGFVLIGGFSIGFFLAPAAFAMMLAAYAPDTPAPTDLPTKGIIYTDTEIEEFRRKGLM